MLNNMAADANINKRVERNPATLIETQAGNWYGGQDAEGATASEGENAGTFNINYTNSFSGFKVNYS